MVARRHLADGLAVHIKYGVAVTGYGLVVQFDAHQFAAYALGLLFQQGFAANELRLVELHKHRQSGHDGRNVLTQLVAIERQPHLEAQRVATAEAAGLHLGGYQLVPALADVVVRGIYFESVLTRVTGTRDDGLAYHLAGVEHQIRALKPQHRLDDMLRLRPLNGYLSVKVGLVLQFDVEALGLLLHPRPVLVDVGGVDDQEEIVLAQLVDQQVVHRSAVFVAHHAVENLPHRHVCDVVGEDMVHVALGLAAPYCHLAHVAHVEQSDVFTDGGMLGCNTCILIKQRHVEASELDHHGPQRHVLVVQTGTFHFFLNFLSDSHRL